MDTIRLHLGSGRRPQGGFINVDREASASPDVVLDLELTPWPWANESVDEIRAEHVLEHLGHQICVFLAIISEMHRVLIPGGVLRITVPHWRSDSYWGDPTHVRAITPQMLGLFSRKENLKSKEWANTPLAEYLDVDFELKHTEFVLTPYWSKRYSDKELSQAELDYAMNSLWNVVDEVKMTLMKVARPVGGNGELKP
jgi:SAM-dependent methyltransferase